MYKGATRGKIDGVVMAGINASSKANSVSTLLNWAWKSSKTFGHAFIEHGSQLSIT